MIELIACGVFGFVAGFLVSDMREERRIRKQCEKTNLEIHVLLDQIELVNK
jgi:hypothetical protein